jgi:hypothetical protein
MYVFKAGVTEAIRHYCFCQFGFIFHAGMNSRLHGYAPPPGPQTPLTKHPLAVNFTPNGSNKLYHNIGSRRHAGTLWYSRRLKHLCLGKSRKNTRSNKDRA